MVDSIPDPVSRPARAPVLSTPPRVAAALKRGADQAKNLVIPSPIPTDSEPPAVPEAPIVVVGRREIRASINPETGRAVFYMTVNGREVTVPPEGWLV